MPFIHFFLSQLLLLASVEYRKLQLHYDRGYETVTSTLKFLELPNLRNFQHMLALPWSEFKLQ